ncbi:PREDICTED: RILP-like protein 1, partial [Myotis brandtii]|uniref:RILP-like protein 1 n=1 Tax=Myotis brandtii TaxID=109478 RepID=UPI000703E69C
MTLISEAFSPVAAVTAGEDLSDLQEMRREARSALFRVPRFSGFSGRWGYTLEGREQLPRAPSQNGEEEPEAEPGGEESISEAEKAAMDLKDPNRPRFTLQELRDVLHERNELKSKVFLLQEELAYYKSEEIEEENRILQPPPIVHPRMSPQPESGIKRLKEGPLSDGFSFFSRDKKRLATTQRGPHGQESF